MKKVYLLGFLILTIGILFGVRAYVSNSITTSGVELGKAEDEARALRTENINIKEKILELSSLTHIASEAGELGFEESKANFALSKERPIAYNQ